MSSGFSGFAAEIARQKRASKKAQKKNKVKDEKTALKERRRTAAIKELLSTEKTYVHLMGNLITHYVQKLRANRSMISADDFRVVFPSDLHAILGLNQTFLDDLTKVIESRSFNMENSKIGNIIFAFCPHFKMYQNYLNNYKAAAARLAQLRKKSSSSFSKYCDQQREMPYFNNLNIESLIILPIQRMPRYKILLEEIIKHTELNHPDLKQLKSALTKISEVNASINERIKEFESRIKVQNIENRFNGKVTNLVTPSRRYIKEGQLCKIKNQDDEDYLFILFSDCILYASQSMIGDKLVFGNLIQFNSKFKVKKTSDAINVHKIAGLFELHSPKESFMLYSATRQQRDEWVDAISETYEAYMSLTSSVMNEQAVGLKDVYSATLMIPNDFASECMVKGCNTKFSIINGRHHCRYCGLVCCSKCSSRKLNKRPTHISKNMKAQQILVRVCDVCYEANLPPPKMPQKKDSIAPPSASLLDAIKSMQNGKPPEKRKSAFGFISKSVPKKPSKKGNSNSLNDYIKKQEDELLEKFAQRAQKHQEEKAKNDKISANPLHKEASPVSPVPASHKEAKTNMFPTHDQNTKKDSTPKQHKKRNGSTTSLPPPPPPTATLSKSNSAVNLAKQFVKLDIEPKLIALEENKRKLESKVCALELENKNMKSKMNALETQNKSLQNELKEKEDEIKKLWATLAKSGVVNLELTQSNTSNISLKLDDESPPNTYFDEDHKMKEVQKRICITCDKEIIGRALQTKDGLIHKECHTCIECGTFLLGKTYAVLWEDDKKVKICEPCVEDARDERKKMAKESMSRKMTFVVSDDMD